MNTGQTCRRVCSGLAWMAGLEGGDTGHGWTGSGGSSLLLPSGSSQAASFGKCFLDRFPPDSFVRMCQDLRVLNAVRDYHIGIPLTYSQYPQACWKGVYSQGWQGTGKGLEMPPEGLWQIGLFPSWILNRVKCRYKQLTIQVLLDRYSKPKGCWEEACGWAGITAAGGLLWSLPLTHFSGT